jgi:hypothetical protein
LSQKFPSAQRAHWQWGRADFFDDRTKSILVRLADMKPSDAFYDMGCGDASLLIYVVRVAGLSRAVGFENMPSRFSRARANVRDAGLEDRITIERDMYDADLSEADVIFDMLPEGRNDLRDFYGRSMHIKDGTKLIKHDLPLIGYMPDRVGLPFYLMRFPLRKARSRDQWAQAVLGDHGATVDQVWRELLYYGSEKNYYKSEVKQFDSLLRSRVPR